MLFDTTNHDLLDGSQRNAYEEDERIIAASYRNALSIIGDAVPLGNSYFG